MLVPCPHFYLGFRFVLVHATGFLVPPHSYSHFLLSCDEDVGETDEDEVEELVDETPDNEWHVVLRVTLIFAVLDEVGNRPVFSLNRMLRKDSSNQIAVVPILHFTLAVPA